MKFFIDTASLAQIKEAQDLGVLDGVTTNPSLMAKEGISGTDAVMKHYVNICNIVEGDVSAEVIATDYDGMVREGENLAALHPQILHRKRDQDQLHAGIQCWAGIIGRKGRSHVRIAVHWSVG